MVETIERTTALLAFRREREASLRDALAAMGVELPGMGRFTEAGGMLLARVAPFQVLAMRVGVDLPLMAELKSLGTLAGVIDLSDSRVGVVISGPRARSLLTGLVPLDLHPSRFEPGMCAQTLAAHLSVLLLQTGPDAYELQCGRSFAGSFLHAMAG